MRKKRITVYQAIEGLLAEGFSDVLLDTCGLWFRQPENVKEKYGKLFVSYIDRKYDEHIAFLEVERPYMSFV